MTAADGPVNRSWAVSSTRSPQAMRCASAANAAGRRASAQAGEQFAGIERFGQVIVRPGVQPGHTVADLGERGQHQHRRFDAARAGAAQHGKAVQFGQHAVQNAGVVAAGAQKRETFRPAAAAIGRKASRLQRRGAYPAQRGVVFNE